MYGNPVHMLPTEDFLSLYILVKLSTIAKKTKIQIALYNMRFAMNGDSCFHNHGHFTLNLT